MTVGEALRRSSERLRGAGIEAPLREARLLLAHSAGLAPEIILGWPERTVAEERVAHFDALIERRCRREPVARIIGRREFWSLDFAVTPDTLDPRSDTETVVEAALASVDRGGKLRILDLGTGTGCLLLALLHELPNAWGLGVDRSPAAVRVARDNARRLALDNRAEFFAGDWGTALGGGFDVVVANPPYIPLAEVATLEPDVRLYDPPEALSGGPDGLDAYCAIAPDLRRLLCPNGFAALEVGAGQAEPVAGLLHAAGLRSISFRHDLAGIARVVTARSPDPQK